MIGMYGGSYLGFIQWEGALYSNPHLAALIPEVSPDDHYDNIYPSGAFQLSNSLDLLWFCCGGRTDEPASVMDWPTRYEHLPIKEDAAWVGLPNVGLWHHLLSHPDRDQYWAGVGERIAPGENGPGHYDHTHVPTLSISGWYGQVSQATMNNYSGVVHHGPSGLRGSHKLIMGPWTHARLSQAVEGDFTFPNQAAPNGNALRLSWFDYWLKGRDGAFLKDRPVSIYTMGRDTWRFECEWPLRRTQYTKYYLHSDGTANSLLGGGTLSRVAPSGEGYDRFTYDPARPVPTLGGNVAMHPARAGPYDQTAIELSSDILVFTTEPLTEDLEVTGPVTLHHFASTDRTDTDFTGKLVDVHPDGYAQILLVGHYPRPSSCKFSNGTVVGSGEDLRFLY
jgi:hypothetical protein